MSFQSEWVESPVPFKKGDKVYYKNDLEHRSLEVESVQWVLDDGVFTRGFTGSSKPAMKINDVAVGVFC